MKKANPEVCPPRWASRFLTWYCRPELAEDLEGDLHEYFVRNVEEKGLRYARLIYIIDVLKFLRPYTVRKPSILKHLTQWLMMGSYVRTSGRSMVRSKLFSAINIVGLAISMSVGLLIIAMLMDLYSYDRFHEKGGRIFRVNSRLLPGDGQDKAFWATNFMATSSIKAAREIRQSITGVEEVAILQRDFSKDLTVGEKTIPLSGFWANEAFFDVFSFPLLRGDAKTALRDPLSLVLTEESAKKLFGEEDPLGRTVTVGQGGDSTRRDFTVTGVMKNLPFFSHMRFDMLGSLSTRELIGPHDEGEMAWNHIWNTWSYLLLENGADQTDILRKLSRVCERENQTTMGRAPVELALQPLGNIMVGKDLGNEIGPTMNSSTVWVMGGLAFIVILSACLNYTNLSVARSFRRSREVGIRKTIGAHRAHVVGQFIVESVMIALVALILAFGIFLLIKPHFLSMESSLQRTLALDLSPALMVMFLVFAVMVGICAGLFPALFFSRINAIHVLKNFSAVPIVKGLTVRKALIVFQYCISLIAITTTLIFYKQYKHFIHFDLGFSTANVLNVRLQGNDAALLEKALQELPEVKSTSRSLLITSTGNYWGSFMKNVDAPQDSAVVGYNGIDEHYLSLHEHTLVAGRNFIGFAGQSEESELIVNESAVKEFDLGGGDPQKAIGETVVLNGNKLIIIGVMKDFFYTRANDQMGGSAVVMRYMPGQAQYLNVKIVSSDWPHTYEKLETIWKAIDPVHPLDARFYDEQIAESFNELKASAKAGSFLAFMVISIASIGLLGMVVFTSETRRREVSIRKVFGASEVVLLFLLSKGFLWLLVLATAIGLPVTYVLFDQVFLPQFANHAPLGVSEFSVGFFAVTLIALIMVGSQTLRVARANPAEVLRAE